MILMNRMTFHKQNITSHVP